MIQVWIFDNNGFLVESKIIKASEITANMTEVPILTGFVKAKFNGVDWIEGATEDEIAVWQEEQSNQIKEPTEIEKLQQEVAGTNAMVLEFMEAILMGGM